MHEGVPRFGTKACRIFCVDGEEEGARLQDLLFELPLVHPLCQIDVPDKGRLEAFGEVNQGTFACSSEVGVDLLGFQLELLIFHKK